MSASGPSGPLGLKRINFFKNAFGEYHFSINSLEPNQDQHFVRLGQEVIKLFSCSTQLSMTIQLLIETKMPNNKYFSCFQTVFIILMHVKMPTIVGILTLMSMIIFRLS